VRLTDLLILPVAALWQQKLRTLLTTLGVVFGAFVLAASLSIGEGVQETIDRESHRNDISRRIEVFPKWNRVGALASSADVKVEGNMTDARRERIRKSLLELKQLSNPAGVRTELTRQRMDQLAALSHVDRLVPLVYNDGFALFGSRSERALVLSARPDDESCRRRIVAGRLFDAPDQRAVVVSEFLACAQSVLRQPIRLPESVGPPPKALSCTDPELRHGICTIRGRNRFLLISRMVWCA
jgi:putative ABC transport system permease protein